MCRRPDDSKPPVWKPSFTPDESYRRMNVDLDPWPTSRPALIVIEEVGGWRYARDIEGRRLLRLERSKHTPVGQGSEDGVHPEA